MPLISVIVPIYNAGNALSRCIDSILGQVFSDFELILVDDGSVDVSGQIADNYSANDSRIRVFHKENGGVASARNLGLDEAMGQWITFCDADDYVDSLWLRHYIDNKLQGDDLVVQGIEQELGGHRFFSGGVELRGTTAAVLAELYKQRMPGSVCTKLFERDIIERHCLRFDGRFNYQEDEEFVLRYATYCKTIHSVGYTGYHYVCSSEMKEKYKVINSPFALTSSMYGSVISIVGDDPHSILYDRIGEKLLATLIQSFRDGESDRKEKLRCIRHLMGKKILNTRFFAPSKWIIYLDFTYP